MENGLLFEIIKDIIAGVLTALVLLPINTEAIQEKLFGKRKRVLKTAKAELLDVVKNMVFSGQRVADTVFEKIRTSIANKHRIKVEELGFLSFLRKDKADCLRTNLQATCYCLHAQKSFENLLEPDLL